VVWLVPFSKIKNETGLKRNKGKPRSKLKLQSKGDYFKYGEKHGSSGKGGQRGQHL